MKAADMLAERPGDLALPLHRDDALEAGIELARRTPGWTFIAMPATVTSTAALIAAGRTTPLVAWSAPGLTLLGLGVAAELRGHGDARWQELVTGARALADATIFDPLGVATGDARRTLIRPRWLGGLAFAPGAADGAPWSGFGDAWFALPRWTYVHDGTRAALLLAVTAREAQHAPRWRAELTTLRAALATAFVARPQPAMRALDPGDVEGWRDRVRAITAAIGRGECAKIVAARRATVTLVGEARAADLLAELDARHADCVRVLVRPPGAGTLVAVTPERLVQLDGAHVACDALAGTIARDAAEPGIPGTANAALLASDKDRREHQLVVQTIAAALGALGAEVDAPAAPDVRTLRHVLHLHTAIVARLRARRHLLELAAALHPTPAVGGAPTRVATAWIASHEAEARGWYAAPVGWFDLDGNGELAVAIRSGVLAGERAHLWAGAGIVAGSEPGRELAETDLKLRAMLGALGVSS
jgi:isochorismate synthase